MWWRRLAEVQTEHQNGEERGFKWLNVEWLLVQTDWSEYSQTADLLGFSHTTISSVYREWSKKRNIQWAAVVWTKMSCWCQRRMGRLVRDDRRNGNSNNHSLQPRCAEYHLWTHNTSNLEADEWMNEWCIYIALFVYCCTPKALYNHVGGGGSLLNHHQCVASTWMMRRLPQDNGTSALTTHQLQVERMRERDRANQVDGDYYEAMIDKGQWWEFGQDTGVTPYSLREVPWDF